MTIYLPPELIAQQNGIILPADKARYLSTVIRVKAGDHLRIIDGRGMAFEALIADIRKGAVTIDITGQAAAAPEISVRTILAIGMLKGEKMDLVVQKATELGASGIIPLITERSQLRTTRKTERWRRIAEEASEQCDRAVIPVIDEPQELPAYLSGFNPDVAAGLFFYEKGGAYLDQAITGISEALHLCIGPEGGFSAAEAGAAGEAGFRLTTLGGRILRAETAAISALAITHFCLERR